MIAPTTVDDFLGWVETNLTVSNEPFVFDDMQREVLDHYFGEGWDLSVLDEDGAS